TMCCSTDGGGVLLHLIGADRSGAAGGTGLVGNGVDDEVCRSAAAERKPGHDYLRSRTSYVLGACPGGQSPAVVVGLGQGLGAGEGGSGPASRLGITGGPAPSAPNGSGRGVNRKPMGHERCGPRR